MIQLRIVVSALKRKKQCFMREYTSSGLLRSKLQNRLGTRDLLGEMPTKDKGERGAGRDGANFQRGCIADSWGRRKRTE